MSRFPRVLWLPLLLLAAGAAHAGGTVNPAGVSAWDVFAFGNGDVMASVLTAISLMVKDSVYQQMLGFLALLGFVAMVVSSGVFVKSDGKIAGLGGKLIGQFVAILLVAELTIGLTGSGPIVADVLVTDIVSGNSTMVQDVPAVVAVPASVVSTASQLLTEAVERNFALPGVAFPDEMKMANGAPFMLASSLVQDGAKIQINDPYLRQSMATYSSDCVTPLIANGIINTADLINSPNVWEAIKSESNSVYTVYYSAAVPNGTTIPCATAYGAISTDITTALPAILSDAAGAWGSTAATASLGNAMNSALFWMSAGGINDGAGYIKQSTVINVMKDANATTAASTNNSELLLTMALEQAKQSQITGWSTAAEVFKATMGYIYSVLQAFVMAISPIIVAVMVMGAGYKLLTSYLGILVWLALWTPLLAVVNFLVSAYAQADIASLLVQGGNITFGNLPAVSEKTSKMMAAASFLATLIPVFSYGLIKGSIAFTEFVSQGMGSAFASSAASNAATGNASWGNTSLDNTNMNKHSYASQTALGHMATDVHMGLGAMREMHQMGGPTVTAFEKAQGLTTVEASRTQTAGQRAELARSVDTSNKRTDQAASSLQLAAKDAVTEQFGLGEAASTEARASKDWNSRVEGGKQLSTEIARANSDKTAGTETTEQRVAAIVGAALRASGNDIAKAAASTQRLANATRDSGSRAATALRAAASALGAQAQLQTTTGTNVSNTETMETSVSRSTRDANNWSKSGSAGQTGSQSNSSGRSANKSDTASDTHEYSENLSRLSSFASEHTQAQKAQEAAHQAFEAASKQSTSYTVEGDSISKVMDTVKGLNQSTAPLDPTASPDNGVAAHVRQTLGNDATASQVAAGLAQNDQLIQQGRQDLSNQQDNIQARTENRMAGVGAAANSGVAAAQNAANAAVNGGKGAVAAGSAAVNKGARERDNAFDPTGKFIPNQLNGEKGNEYADESLAVAALGGAASVAAGLYDLLPDRAHPAGAPPAGPGGTPPAGPGGNGGITRAPNSTLPTTAGLGLGGRLLMGAGVAGMAYTAYETGHAVGQSVDQLVGDVTGESLSSRLGNSSVGQTVFGAAYNVETGVRNWWNSTNVADTPGSMADARAP